MFASVETWSGYVGLSIVFLTLIGTAAADLYSKWKKRRAKPAPEKCGKTVRDTSDRPGETKCVLDKGHEEPCIDLMGNQRDELGFHKATRIA